jgi:phosphoesterase RecJ-like protein
MTLSPLPAPWDADYVASLLRQWQELPLAVCGHQRPDGDCIGSQVALTRFLRDRGLDAVALQTDAIPRTLRAFAGDTPFHENGHLPAEPRTAVTVDCADAARIGADLREAMPGTLLNIDHHRSNPGYGEHNLVDSRASATAEILAELFLACQYRPDPTTASALYLGIATDTGQFRYPSTTPRTFEICHWLCECGADPAGVATLLYERETPGKMRLLSRFLESLRLECDGQVCTSCLREEDYRATATSREDSEGFVDYARSLEGVRIGVYVEEKGGHLKGSLRCKDPFFQVDAVARLWNGGGHACAAGFNLENTSYDTFHPQLVATLAEHLASLGTPPADTVLA